MNADEALARLMDGNARYTGGRATGPNRDEGRRQEQAEGQTPFAVVLACADSRVAPELIFDQGIGDLFVVRVAGNTAAEEVTLGSIEFGVSVLGCPLLMVLGHESCGAVKAAVDGGAEGHLAALVAPIVPAVDAVRGEADDVIAAAVDENVRRQIAALAETFPSVTVVGARYDLHTGAVSLVEQ